MAYEQADEIIAERKARAEAVQLLLTVAEEKKGVAEVRMWLEENYPELCTETKKRW